MAILKKTGKKAAVEIQFNWIFVLIAGAVILMFFITLAGKYKDNAEQKLSYDVLSRLSAISTSGQMSSDTNTLIDVGKIRLSVGCDPYTCNEYGCSVDFDISNKGIPPPSWMSVEPFFSPGEINGDQLITWSLDWSKPYKVLSIAYLTSPSIRYVLVYNESSASEAFAIDLSLRLKENKNLFFVVIETNELSALKHAGESFTKFVFLYKPVFDEDKGLNIHDSIKAKNSWDVMFIEANDLEYGSVYFSKQTGANSKRIPDMDKSAQYFGFPLLVGAIYSDDYEFYTCNIIKLMYKYRDINTIYDKKRQMLYDEFKNKQGSNCAYYYGAESREIFSKINDSINSALELKGNNIVVSLNQISGLETSLDNLNTMAQRNDCPRIY